MASSPRPSDRKKARHAEISFDSDTVDLIVKRGNEERLCRELATNTTVTTLTLRFVDDAERRHIERMLPCNTCIRSLTVVGRSWGKGLGRVLNGLKCNTSIRKLTISQFEFGTIEVDSLRDLIASHATLTHITLVRVEFPYFSESSFIPIADAVSSTCGLDTLELDARRTNIDMEIGSFSKLLSRLRCLRISSLDDLGQRRPSREELASIREAISDNPNVEELSLSSCGLAGSQLLDAMLSSLLKSRSLRHLNLSNNGFDCIDAIRIASFVETCSSLRVLLLSGNQIGNTGWNALVAALQRNPNLHTLDLSRNLITHVGQVNTLLEEFNCLKSLDLSFNQLDPWSVKAIAYALNRNTSLASLTLRLGGVDREGALAFCHALQYHNRTLKSLAFGSRLSGDATFIWTSSIVQEYLSMLQENTSLDQFSDVFVWPSLERTQALHLLTLNRSGRKDYLPGELPSSLWPYVLKRATHRGGLTALLYLLQEKPSIVKPW